MNDAVIVDAVRTPVGKRNGGLADIHPADLSAHVLTSLAERTGVRPAEIDDVVWGCVSQSGDQAINIGRTAVLAAGWPETVTATTVNRACGSSQQSAHFAAAGVIAGHYDFVVAGGVESMTRVPMGSAGQGGQPTPPSVQQRYGVGLDGLVQFLVGIEFRRGNAEFQREAFCQRDQAQGRNKRMNQAQISL